MHARLIATTRLAARYAQTGLHSRVHAAQVLNLARSANQVALPARLFSSARIAFEQVSPSSSVQAEAESTSFTPAAAETAETSTPAAPTSEASASPEDLTKRTIFVGGLSWNVDNQWLEDEVNKALDLVDGVSNVRIARNNLGKSRGFAFVELTKPELVQQLNGQRANIDGRDVEFVASTSTAPKPRAPRSNAYDGAARGPRNPPGPTLWVGNVSWSASAGDLEDAFGRFGDIVRVNQPTDRETGRSRGIAYIEFSETEHAQEAYAQVTEQGLELEGRSLRVDYAAPKTDRDSNRHLRNSSGGFRPRGENRGGERREYRGRQQREEEW
ncbi:RNA-binding protein [Sporobolomyces koalae]|uniref:RNA-binding protein n=1 Tax=Sporobolomyces koalae TaxID=500713 RepID=UPI00317E9A3D